MSENSSPHEIVKLKFDALKLKYEDQVALLRFLTTFDFQIFSGFLTLQLVFASWLSTTSIKGSGLSLAVLPLTPSQKIFATKMGLLILDGLLGCVAARLLHTNKLRRVAIVGIVRNLNEALGFNDPGIYLDQKAINVEHTFRPWASWYIFVVLLSYIGVVLVMFAA